MPVTSGTTLLGSGWISGPRFTRWMRGTSAGGELSMRWWTGATRSVIRTSTSPRSKGSRRSTSGRSRDIAVRVTRWLGSSIVLPSTTSVPSWQIPQRPGRLSPVPALASYRVGDHVKVRFGKRDVVVEVVEDRGFIGHGGEQIVRVAMPIETDTIEFEVPASSAAPVERPRARSTLASAVSSFHAASGRWQQADTRSAPS